MNLLRLALVAVILNAGASFGFTSDEPVVLTGHVKQVSAVAWAADGKSLATASDDRTLRIWDSNTGRQTAVLERIARPGYGGPVVAFTSDLNVVAVNYWGRITIRSLPEGEVRGKIDPILDRGQRSAFRPDVFAMAFSPDGKRLATAGSVAAVGGPHGLPGGIVIVWDVETGKILHRSPALSTAAGCVAWSKDGRRFAAGTNGAGGELPEAGEVTVWDAESGKVLRNFKVKPDVDYGEWASAGDVALSPDGNRVATPVTAGSRGKPAGLLIGDSGASVRVWNLKTNKSTQIVKGLKSKVERLAFSRDGSMLATASRDGLVRLWSLESGQKVATLQGSGRMSVVAFGPNDKALAAASKDGSVRIWTLHAER